MMPREGRGVLARLHDARARIDELLPRLEQVNKAFANVTKPSAGVWELDSAHRRELARRIRAASQDWEDVTRQINEALALLNP